MDLIGDGRRPTRQHARILANRPVAAARYIGQHAVKPNAAAAAAAAAAGRTRAAATTGPPLWHCAPRFPWWWRAEGAGRRWKLLAAMAGDDEAGALAYCAAMPLERSLESLEVEVVEVEVEVEVEGTERVLVDQVQ